MAVFRINKTDNYTIMSNYHLQDKRLSLKAKGLLSQMLSLPDTWDYSLMGLVSINKEEQKAIKSALNELKDCGYVKIEKFYPKSEERTKIEYIYNIFEKPNQEYHFVPLQNVSLQDVSIQKDTQLNTNNKNTKEVNTKDKYLSCASSQAPKHNTQIDDFFESMWKLYPKKQGKSAVSKKAKAEIFKAGKETIELAIANYMKEIERLHREEQYILMGSSFFNTRWRDYVYSNSENDIYSSAPKGQLDPDEIDSIGGTY